MPRLLDAARAAKCGSAEACRSLLSGFLFSCLLLAHFALALCLHFVCTSKGLNNVENVEAQVGSDAIHGS